MPLELDLEKTRQIQLCDWYWCLWTIRSDLKMKLKYLSSFIAMHNLSLLRENLFTVEELPSEQKVGLVFWQLKQNIPSGYCRTCKEDANYICNYLLGFFNLQIHAQASRHPNSKKWIFYFGVLLLQHYIKKEEMEKCNGKSSKDLRPPKILRTSSYIFYQPTFHKIQLHRIWKECTK